MRDAIFIIIAHIKQTGPIHRTGLVLCLSASHVNRGRAFFAFRDFAVTTSPTLSSSKVTPFKSLEWKKRSFASPSRAMKPNPLE